MSYFKIVISNPWKFLFLSIFLVLMAGAGFKNFYINSDYEVFFDGANERLQAHQELEREYGRKDAVRIGIAPKSGTVFNPTFLKIIEELTEEAWQIPHSTRVESLTNFQYSRNVDGELATDDLFTHSEQIPEAEFAKRIDYALQSPSILHLYVNPEGTMAGLQALVSMSDKNSSTTAEIADFASNLVATFSTKYPEVNFYLTGSISTNDAFFKASTVGTAKLLLAMLALSLILLAVFLRSPAIVFIGLCLIISSTVIGFGSASWLGLPFTAFSSSALILIISVVIASSVHILSQFRQEYVSQAKEKALLVALESNWMPIVLTAITTAVGLLCLNFSEIPPSRYLGTTSAIAVLGATLLNFSMLPALICILPVQQWKDGNNIKIYKFWNTLGQFALDKKIEIVVAVSVLAITMSYFSFKNNINDSVLTYFSKDTKFRSDSDYLVDNLFYFYSFDLSIPGGEPNAVNNPEYMRKVDELVSWAKTQPEVYNVISFTDILKNLNRAIHDGNDEWYKLPEQDVVAAEYMLMYELSVPYGMDLNNQINIDKSAAKIIIGFHDVKGNQLIDFDNRLQTWMAENFPEHMRSIPSGPSLMFANIWGDAAKSNLAGMAFAVLAISLIIGIGLRSVTMGLVCIIPNTLPAIFAFGVWGIVDSRIDMGASVVAIIAFGIVVDDSIHILKKFSYAMQKLSMTAKEAVLYTLRTVGQAVSISTIVLVLGFAILASSDFALNSKVGFITLILLSFALLLDIFLLPIILVEIYKKKFKSNQDVQPETSTNQLAQIGFNNKSRAEV